MIYSAFSRSSVSFTDTLTYILTEGSRIAGKLGNSKTKKREDDKIIRKYTILFRNNNI